MILEYIMQAAIENSYFNIIYPGKEKQSMEVLVKKTPLSLLTDHMTVAPSTVECGICS